MGQRARAVAHLPRIKGGKKPKRTQRDWLSPRELMTGSLMENHCSCRCESRGQIPKLPGSCAPTKKFVCHGEGNRGGRGVSLCGLLPGEQEGQEGEGTFCGVISSVPYS